MPAARLRARTTTEIVDAAFTLYRQQPLMYVLAATAGYAPYLLAAMFLQQGDTSARALASGTGIVLLLISTVSYGLMSAVVTQLGSAAYLGEQPDLAQAFRQAMPKSVTLIVAGLIRSVLVAMGAVFLLVPGLYLFARWFAIIPVITIEGRGLGAAFTRSSALSAGRKRHIFNTLGLAWLLFWIVGMGLGIVFILLSFGSPVLATLLTTLVTILLYPVIGLTETVLYYDARIRGEGYDLERMAQALAVPEATPGTPRPA
ncbi:MAG: hypothetical protein HY275_08320 [Gemmatimonadetes bacterium]|nr:hypothetical protein [Gemmatimonadota bacterium]